jgi:hypothetical protein
LQQDAQQLLQRERRTGSASDMNVDLMGNGDADADADDCGKLTGNLSLGSLNSDD